MSASSVILRGYKGGTIVTRGYSLGEEAVAVAVGGGKAVWRYEERELYEPEPRKERLRIVKKQSPQKKTTPLDIPLNEGVVYAQDVLLQAHESIQKLLEPQARYERTIDPLTLQKARDEEDLVMLMTL